LSTDAATIASAMVASAARSRAIEERSGMEVPFAQA
jgi:hypothetical protein